MKCNITRLFHFLPISLLPTFNELASSLYFKDISTYARLALSINHIETYLKHNKKINHYIKHVIQQQMQYGATSYCVREWQENTDQLYFPSRIVHRK